MNDGIDRSHLSNQDLVGEFHSNFCPEQLSDTPRLLDKPMRKLRLKLIREETDELEAALKAGDMVAAADALADLEYVVHGTSLSMGITTRPLFMEVHRSNMSKLGPDGQVLRRDDGKVLKGPG